MKSRKLLPGLPALMFSIVDSNMVSASFSSVKKVWSLAKYLSTKNLMDGSGSNTPDSHWLQ
jgi:hypothetical protein